MAFLAMTEHDGTVVARHKDLGFHIYAAHLKRRLLPFTGL
jgi:hypothetical protein